MFLFYKVVVVPQLLINKSSIIYVYLKSNSKFLVDGLICIYFKKFVGMCYVFQQCLSNQTSSMVDGHLQPFVRVGDN